ncbi:AAA family ATPase [Actinoplanes sp. Pm04-4]|uniref:AAA family ATPase n=1 Tax=Paractinoplanes pyxinae TaxID=2997416 RepID=A0ABT4ATG4_9ACTN|nr:AAA family ATPase [Actinoplanes pyxinae]MCY1137112.1 AAA family ATPase [Actinoplanes pyxinae]
MKLTTLALNNYRSITTTAMNDCSSLNVLIGRNNSGKSNLLSALVFFFRHINPESGLAEIARSRNNFYTTTSSAAEHALVSATFRLSAAEQVQLAEEIANEAPQVRNTLDGLTSFVNLRIKLHLIRSLSVAYIESIYLSDPEAESERSLLGVSAASAAELAKQHFDVRKIQSAIDGLKKAVERANADAERFASADREGVRSLLLNRVLEEVPQGERAELRSRLSVSPPSKWRTEIEEVQAAYVERLQAEKSRELRNSLDTFAGAANTLPGYIKNLLQRVRDIKVLYLNEQRMPVGPREAAQLLLLKVRRGGTNELQTIQSTVAGLLGVQIDAFESGETGARIAGREATAEMDVDNFLVQVNGSGVREALRLILDVRFNSPDILLVEEPEVHLHPALELNMLQFLSQQSTTAQVFLTTHSTNFLDAADTSNIYLVTRGDSTSVRQLTQDESEAEIPKELGLRLSSVFMYDRLVFVEGPSDEAILREFAFKLGLNLSKRSIGFVSMGGARNSAHFANSSTMELLSRRQVRSWFVIDRDERSESEVERLLRMSPETATLHVLARRELENFLLDEEALAAFISLKSSGRAAPDPAEISQVLNEVAEELRDVAVGKAIAQRFCAPLYFDRSQLGAAGGRAAAVALEQLSRMNERISEMIGQVDVEAAEIAADIDAKWALIKFNIIPGTELLDAVLKRYNLRYRKDRDGAAIASLIAEGKVDPSVAELLRSIVYAE